jgi:hypothetical protein
MILFGTSDKGGTGRSVTCTNVTYRTALRGVDSCYVDFDFGSPTSGAIFGVDAIRSGTDSKRGLHSYLLGDVTEPELVELWTASDRSSLRNRPAGAGRLTLLPGDVASGEFATRDPAIVERCRRLFQRLEEEFAFIVVDLSAGRSFATEMSLAVTAGPDSVKSLSRWLVFHRWTRQHVVAAAGLVYEEKGILDTGARLGHDREELLDRLRFVRTATIDPNAPDLAGLRPAQLAWLQDRHQELLQLAKELKAGRGMLLGEIPLDPILQWQEQLLTNSDLYARQVANPVTVQALETLTDRVHDAISWERL